MMCFGIGAMGPLFAGIFTDDIIVYSMLALLSGVAGVMAIFLARFTKNAAATEASV